MCILQCDCVIDSLYVTNKNTHACMQTKKQVTHCAYGMAHDMCVAKPTYAKKNTNQKVQTKTQQTKNEKKNQKIQKNKKNKKTKK